MRLLFLFASVVSLVGPQLEPQNWGQFVGDVVGKWHDGDRKMTLVEPFAYVDPEGVKWDAPKGSVVDGASIPRLAWTIVGGPFEGRYRKASAIHDVACNGEERLAQGPPGLLYRHEGRGSEFPLGTTHVHRRIPPRPEVADSCHDH